MKKRVCSLILLVLLAVMVVESRPAEQESNPYYQPPQDNGGDWQQQHQGYHQQQGYQQGYQQQAYQEPWRQDSFTEVAYEQERGWGESLGDSVGLAFFGGFLVLVAGGLLYWNEGRAVVAAKSYAEGRARVREVSAEEVSEKNEGELVHTTARSKTAEQLLDRVFGVAPPEALRMRRVVEMYQWAELQSSSSQKTGSGSKETTTRYTYERRWSAALIPSGHFKLAADHANPTSLAFPSEEQDAAEVRIGAFLLAPELVTSLGPFVPFHAVSLDGLHDRMRCQIAPDRSFYFGVSPHTPNVGDIRVRFEIVTPSTVSVIAQQRGPRLVPFTTSVGSEIAILQNGTHSAAALFASAEKSSVIVTWILRLTGWLLMTIALSLVQSPLRTVANLFSFIPFISSFVAFCTTAVAWAVSTFLSLLVISIAWLRFRPLLALAIFAVGLCFFHFSSSSYSPSL